MSWRDLIDMAVRNLWKRKLRTFLTVLGVIIGTASIVIMVSIGIGMNESFRQQIESMGSLSVINVYNYSYYGDNKNKDLKLDEFFILSFATIMDFPFNLVCITV